MSSPDEITPALMTTEQLIAKARRVVRDRELFRALADRLEVQAKAAELLEERLREVYEGLAKVARDTGALDGIASLEHERAGRWVDDIAYGRLADATEPRTPYEDMKRRQYDVIEALLREVTGGEGGGRPQEQCLDHTHFQGHQAWCRRLKGHTGNYKDEQVNAEW